MQIFDISQEVFSCEVYPGDPKPRKEPLVRMSSGNVYNLTAFEMCAHNGTHVDAPFHFFREGKTVDRMALSSFVGMACVFEKNGYVTRADAEEMKKKADALGEDCGKRILIKGSAEVTEDAAEAFAQAGILLLGNESQTVGSVSAPMAVHKILLGREIVLLEGIRLQHVPEGPYLLSAAPLNLEGLDGAPCRAVLVKF